MSLRIAARPAPSSAAQLARFQLATPADDADLCSFVAAHAMTGRIQLATHTEPSFFAAAALLGKRPQIIIARDPDTARVAGIGVRTTRHVYLRGQPTRIGHLSYLRIAEPFRHRRDFLLAGYALLKELQDTDPVPFHLTAILQQNAAARRLLEAGIPGLPRYEPLTGIKTFTLCTRAHWCRRTAPVDPASDASSWLAAQMNSRDLFPIDPQLPLTNYQLPSSLPLLTAITSSNTITAAATLLDQRSARQLVIANYSGPLKWSRHPINLVRGAARLPQLPAVGRPINLAHVSRLAYSSDAALLSLLASLAVRARETNIDYLALSLPACATACAQLQSLAVNTLDSVLYAVRWNSDAPLNFPDPSSLYVESALL